MQTRDEASSQSHLLGVELGAGGQTLIQRHLPSTFGFVPSNVAS
jgi:hypothetical protein